jgi:heme/copper-type cytochrome/quinol oxidase subunit 2
MRGWIYVHDAAEYQKWAAENLRAEAVPAVDERTSEATRLAEVVAKGGHAKR